ncbi:sigma 54-interacting transcriptional regulator [Yersinia sp. HM-2024]
MFSNHDHGFVANAPSSIAGKFEQADGGTLLLDEFGYKNNFKLAYVIDWL